MDEEENSSLCERILLDLDNIFKRDTNIVEFDTIDVVDSICNKSPVVYVDHHIAIEKWCVPHLYSYSYTKLINYKMNNQRTDYDLLHQWTRILLLINPDFTSAWNLRRDLVNTSKLLYSDELKFTELVLIRKPKCASVFSYREFLLNYAFKLTKELNENLIENELQVSLDSSSRYSRNYYSWSHRTWIFTIYISNSTVGYILSKIQNDLVITENWLKSHISDYSCLQHRQFIFGYIYKLCSNHSQNISSDQLTNDGGKLNVCKEFCLKEFELLNALQKIYPEQESLFLHRRFMLHATLLWYPEVHDLLKQNEKQFYRDRITPQLNNSTAEQACWSHQLIERYLFYLKRNLNWTFEDIQHN